MSDQHDEQPTQEPAVAPRGENVPPTPPLPAASWPRHLAIALLGALFIVIAVVATGPLWTPLLPWGGGAEQDTTMLRQQIERLAAAQQQSDQQRRQDATAARNAQQALDKRLGAVEGKAAEPASEIAELRRQLQQLSGSAGDLSNRVAAIEKSLREQASGMADLTNKLATVQRSVQAQADVASDLGNRVAAIEKAARAQASVDATDMALVLALLQIRAAVEEGRPFTAENDAFASLARARPEIAAAAAPLAEAAKSGVASRAVLARQLGELTARIDTGAAPATAGGWGDAALAQLRGLVTIRRIDSGVAAAGPDAAIATARSALAGGDLPGAISALDKLTGAAAEAAQPFLRMARQRLAVEQALQHVEALLVARLGGAAAAPVRSGPGG